VSGSAEVATAGGLGGAERASIQYRISRGKKQPEIVEGPDDAALVITVPLTDVGMDPAVAYMQGRLKPVGHTGLLFDALADGTIRDALARLAAADQSP
jgi:hypothetical protein